MVLVMSSLTMADALDDQIISQQKIIKEKQLFLIEAQTYYDQQYQLALKSWDALEFLPLAEQELTDAVEDYRAARSELKILLHERSNIIKAERLLNEKLIKQKTTQNLEKSTANLVKLIGIDISKACELSEKCVNYSELIYLDSSNKIVSGDFIKKDGDIRRDKSPMQESWRWYDTDDKLRIIVDPPNGMNDKIKMVTITNNLGVYFMPDDMVLSNNTRTWNENRYVDNCSTAIIDSTNWLELLPDTINYLRTGCIITDFNSTRSEIIPLTEYDPRTSPNWLFTQWQNESKIKCKSLCFEY